MANANQNSNCNSTDITCECETTEQHPIDFLGDSICKVPTSSVREIVKKYEPDKEVNINFHSAPHYNSGGRHTIAATSSSNATTSSGIESMKMGSNSNGNNSNTASGIDLTVGSGSRSSDGIGSASFASANDSFRNIVSNRSGKLKNVLPEKQFLDEDRATYLSLIPILEQNSSASQYSKESYDSRNRSKENSSQFDFEKDITDASYKSRTSITKTCQGVRITTDIFFDSLSRIPENWIVKRIETDIPQSKIISEFQKNNGT